MSLVAAKPEPRVLVDEAAPMNAVGDLACHVLNSFEGVDGLRDEWNELARRVQAPIYQTYDWCKVWWQHYGIGRELQLMLFRAGGELVGVAPMFIERLGFGPLKIRVARLLSCDHTLALCGPPVVDAHADGIFRALVTRLVQQERCDAIHFGPLSQAYTAIESLRRACGQQSLRVVQDRAYGENTIFELPDGFDGYLRSLSKNQRSNYKRNLNGLTKSFEFNVDVVSEASAMVEFERFVEMHQEQWQGVGQLGHFADWPGALEFHRDLVETAAKSDQLRLVRLIANGEVVAYYFCLVFGECYYWRLPARKVGPQWDRFALGRIGLFKMLEAAAGEGMKCVEAGNGWYEYKERLNARTNSLHSIVVAADRFRSRALARVLLMGSAVLDKVYYRLWFSRVAPRLPIRRRGLRMTWIRSRF